MVWPPIFWYFWHKLQTMMQGWYYVKSLTGQRHDRVKTGQLFRPCWVSSAQCHKKWSTRLAERSSTKCKWWWPKMKLKSKIFAVRPMSHAKHVTKDNRKIPEYHVVVALRRLRTDDQVKLVSWQNWRSNEHREPSRENSDSEMSTTLNISSVTGLLNW